MTSSLLPTAHDLARMSLAAQHPLGLDWCPEAVRLEGLQGEHAFDLQLATDTELAQGRAERMALGHPAGDYLNRWLSVTGDLQAMLSIRFEGGDPERPFVDVSVSSRPLVATDVPDLLRAARQTYAAFQAPRLRLWSALAVAEAGSAFPHARPDMRVLAAPLVSLRDREVPAGLSLVPTRDHSHYDDAVAAYAAVDAAYPDHPRQAKILSTEDLQDTIDAGTMFDVLWQGQWSGYAGTLPETQLGLPAQVVQELLLAPHARGQGLGAALSTLLARHLPDDGRVLSGTIHIQNQGSLQAATRAGRHDTGGWWFLPLA